MDTVEPTTVAVSIGGQEVVYHLIETNAPPAFDYGYVIVLYVGLEGQRFILVPAESLAHQKGRNLSGMYSFEPSSEFDEHFITGLLWAHVYKYDWTA